MSGFAYGIPVFLLPLRGRERHSVGICMLGVLICLPTLVFHSLLFFVIPESGISICNPARLIKMVLKQEDIKISLEYVQMRKNGFL